MNRTSTLLVLLLGLATICCKSHSGLSRVADELPETQPAVLKPVSVDICPNIGGYMEALPARYDSTTKKYPLLLFLHGMGELGNGTTDLQKATRNGTTALLRNKTFPPNFVVNKKNYSFIVLAPQFKKWPWPVDVDAMLNYAIAHYRIDTTRMYISGLSMGGGITWEYAWQYPNRVAAVVPICGASSPADNKGQIMAQAKLAVWAFHNKDDSVVTWANSTGYVSKINSFNPNPPAKVTVWPTGGHNSWRKATDPSYKEEDKNMYEWMLQYQRSRPGRDKK